MRYGFDEEIFVWNFVQVVGFIIISNGCNKSIVFQNKCEEIKDCNVLGGDIMFWHQWLGHIVDKGLQALQGKGMIQGMSH